MPHITKVDLENAHFDNWGLIGGIDFQGTDIEGIIATMNNCASILADYLIAKDQAEQKNISPPGFLHGADDSWFDYMPQGLDVVSKFIDIWQHQVEPDDENLIFDPELGKGEIYFQDCTPTEAVESLTTVLNKSGFNTSNEEEL